MALFTGQMTVKDANNEDVILTVEIEINEDVSQDINIEYISALDGGPVMRPAKPPRI